MSERFTFTAEDLDALPRWYAHDCPHGPHRGPEGPDEDIMACYSCGGTPYAVRRAGCPGGPTDAWHPTDDEPGITLSNALHDRTGTTREARTLSGCDVGREIWDDVYEKWVTIASITHHPDGDVTVCFPEPYALTATHYPPTSLVPVRGRDE